MTMVYDYNARKKATNVSINSDLLKQAKELKINLSKTLEQNLEQIIKTKKIESWKQQNKEAIEHYNKNVEKHGVFSDEMRQF